MVNELVDGDTMRLGSLPWQDRFSVGDPRIDADHRRFFDYFAEAAGQVDQLAGSPVLQRLFMAIVDDLLRHLATEEQILAQAGYNGLAAHRISHQVLAAQAKAAVSICRDGEWVTALRLLASLVVEHISVEDAKARPWLAAPPLRESA